MNLAVLGDRVFVVPDENPDMATDGLLHLVSDTKRQVNRGTVVAVGEGPELAHRAVQRYLKALSRHFDAYIHDDVLVDGVRAVVAHLKTEATRLAAAHEPEHLVLPGDQVIFSPEAGEEVCCEGGTFLVLKETDILAVINPEQETA